MAVNGYLLPGCSCLAKVIVDMATMSGHHFVVKLPRPSAGSRYRALLQLLRAADAVWNLSRIFFSQWHLSPSQFNVLNVLRSEPKGISQIELGRVLITHRSNVTGLINRLEIRGLVRRKTVKGDKRAYHIFLTAKGAELLKEILPAYYESADKVWGYIPARRANRLSRELASLEKSAQKFTSRAAASWTPMKP